MIKHASFQFLILLAGSHLASFWLQAEDSRPSGESKPIKLTFQDFRPEASSPAIIPKRIKKFDKSRVQIRGYIASSSMAQKTGVRFTLVRDNQEYAPWPVHNNIHVEMTEKKKVRYTTRPVTVVGIFRVSEKSHFRGGLYSYFFLQDAELVP